MPDPLDALRPLHAPIPVSWWPPAPGWWFLVIGVVLVLILFYRHWQRLTPRRAALRELKILQRQNTQHTAALNTLLKRYALVCWPSTTVASLTGEQWLVFLDTHGGNGQFSQGCGRSLATTPYADESLQQGDLAALVRRWIKKNKPKKNA